MASETSGDFGGVCEHPTRIPTTSSASEAKHTGKVLILDLLITITHQAVVIECTLYCCTLLPNYSQSTSGGLGTCPVLAWRSAACGFRCRWRQSSGYITARPKPEGDGRQYVRTAAENRSVLRTEPTLSSRVSHWTFSDQPYVDSHSENSRCPDPV